MEDFNSLTEILYWEKYIDVLEFQELTVSELKVRGYFSLEEEL